MNSCGHDLGMVQGKTMIDDQIKNNINVDCQFNDKELLVGCSGFEGYPIEGLLYSKMTVSFHIIASSRRFEDDFYFQLKTIAGLAGISHI